jgi:hypothetical protein
MSTYLKELKELEQKEFEARQALATVNLYKGLAFKDLPISSKVWIVHHSSSLKQYSIDTVMTDNVVKGGSLTPVIKLKVNEEWFEGLKDQSVLVERCGGRWYACTNLVAAQEIHILYKKIELAQENIKYFQLTHKILEIKQVIIDLGGSYE